MIVDRVESLTAGASSPHQSHVAEQPQLMRDGRLAHPHERRDVTHAELAVGERVEDADARGIAEHTEGFGKYLDGGRRQQCSPPLVGANRVEMRRLTRFVKRMVDDLRVGSFEYMSTRSYICQAGDLDTFFRI